MLVNEKQFMQVARCFQKAVIVDFTAWARPAWLP